MEGARIMPGPAGIRGIAKFAAAMESPRSSRSVAPSRQPGATIRPIRVALAVIAVCGLSPVETGWTQAVDTTLWVTNGTVNAVLRSGNTIYLGGGFTQLGPA